MTKNRTTATADSITLLKQRRAGLAARHAELEGGLRRAVAERDALAEALPDLRSRGLVNGDEGARAELQNSNARLLVTHDTVAGFEHEAGRCKAELAQVEAELAEAERASKLAEADAHLRAADEAEAEYAKHIDAAGAAAQRVSDEIDAADRLYAALEMPPVDRRGRRRVMGARAVRALSGNGARSSVDLGALSRMTPNEARRYLQ